MTLSVATLGDLLDTGHALACSCDHCRSIQPDADLAELIRRLGRDFVWVHPTKRLLAPYLICPDCLGELDYRLSPPAGGVGQAHSGGWK